MGANDEAEEVALRANGWKETKEDAWGEEAPQDTPHPLDHDGDGHKGGSLPGKRRGRPRKVVSSD